MIVDHDYDEEDDDDDDMMYNYLIDCVGAARFGNSAAFRRIRADRQNNFPLYADVDITCVASQNINNLDRKVFRALFRMSREQFDRLLNLVIPNMKKRTYQGGNEVPLWIRIGTVIQYLGGIHYGSISSFFDVNNAFVYRHLDDTLDAIISTLGGLISFPFEDLEGVRRLALGFQSKGCLPGIIGCLDGTLIEIEKPKLSDDLGEVEPASFFDRNGNYSVQLMGIAGAEGEFLHCECSWAGSRHDAACLDESDFLQLFNGSACQRSGFFIAADSAYGLKPWMMVSKHSIRFIVTGSL